MESLFVVNKYFKDNEIMKDYQRVRKLCYYLESVYDHLDKI